MIKNGVIFLVGFGPGSEEHMTIRAREAIREADVVIGYSTYIKLVAELLEGKEVIRKGMTEEIDRCIEAYEHAKLGKKVALISSGDIGVYGMAGPTYEVLLDSGWTPSSDITVEVIPGSTALSACASLVGAPLTHDFCSISLSDLLTPWPTIMKRLDAAANSDFVLALYNPKSGRRTQQIEEAKRILLKYRDPDTPVAIVKSAYRDMQNIQMSTLATMTDCKIGMLTTVLIGNSNTFVKEGLMITPRGYANKYDSLSGSVKDGEKRGRSLSMGLEGWKACLREYLREQATSPSLNAIASYFAMPVGDVASAISEATDEDLAGDYCSQPLAINNLKETLEQLFSLGKIRVVVRSDAGAVSELLMESPSLTFKNNWLSIETDAFHLHTDLEKVSAGWLIKRAENLRSVWFLDCHGKSIFNLSLVRQNQQFAPQALSHFENIWQSTLSSNNESEAS